MKIAPTDIQMTSLLGSSEAAKAGSTTAPDAALEEAKRFETVFIAEMLKHSGFAEALSQNAGFGGEAFSSILLEEYAGKIVESGGFGMAKHIYEQLSSEAGHGTKSAV